MTRQGQVLFYICSFVGGPHGPGGSRARVDHGEDRGEQSEDPSVMSEELTLDELADALIAECDGDTRKALLVTLRLNDYLMNENERLTRITPPGMMRGSGGHRS
jgi:hypothetical protein